MFHNRVLRVAYSVLRNTSSSLIASFQRKSKKRECLLKEELQRVRYKQLKQQAEKILNTYAIKTIKLENLFSSFSIV